MRASKHFGVILGPSGKGFDAGATTFSSIFLDESDKKTIYLYYTGASDPDFHHAGIGVATSTDGMTFKKRTEVSPIVEYGKEAVTPAVFKTGNYYYMAFASRPGLGIKGRRISLAVADDPLGPWKILGRIISPELDWEGNDIDIGPSVMKTNSQRQEFVVYYSNATNKRRLGIFPSSGYCLRRIGILRIRIRGRSSIMAKRYEGNPLAHLNGAEGDWSESLFCPGCFEFRHKNYLIPSSSTYSIGFPYRQYIGLVSDTTPYFNNPSKIRILINGPEEKKLIIPEIKSEIALDTASPLLNGGSLYLYYAVMDRSDRIWKTALSMFDVGNLRDR